MGNPRRARTGLRDHLTESGVKLLVSGMGISGVLNQRQKHADVCARCGHRAHADVYTAQNIRDWYGLCCPRELEVPVGGPQEPVPNPVSQTVAQAAASRERQAPDFRRGEIQKPLRRVGGRFETGL
jgi:hypothetical protein